MYLINADGTFKRNLDAATSDLVRHHLLGHINLRERQQLLTDMLSAAKKANDEKEVETLQKSIQNIEWALDSLALVADGELNLINV